MSQNQSLEIKGSLVQNSVAELLIEASESKLDGSFRLSNTNRKVIIYFRNGDLVFAVSNAREHRLFEVFLQQTNIAKEKLVGLPVLNDFEFAQSIIAKGLADSAKIQEIFIKQVEQIVKDSLCWQEGEWIFSALARVKDSINYKINLRALLLEHARTAPLEIIKRTFVNHEEAFSPSDLKTDLPLSSLEAFVFYRFEANPLKLNEIQLACGLPEEATLKAIYTLWLAGLLKRHHRVFSEEQVITIRSARLQPKREETQEQVANVQVANVHVKVDLSKAKEEADKESQLEESQELEAYLKRVENASNYYELLGVLPTSSTNEIKTAYFRIAKKFHPDRYHKDVGTELHKRIQSAFSEIAKAYEVLKDEKSRKSYDLKYKDKIKSEEPKAEDPRSIAEKSFEEGYKLLMNQEYEAAYPFLARATHLDPGNAKYHAYFGKLLSADEKMRFKAEEEIRIAINMEPKNALYRIMLAELYIDYGFYRRAEGELKRLLDIEPNNQQALKMLKELPRSK
jgi:curved DNA-binding protein CbpA